MKIQKIDILSFEGKNTFLQKSEKAVSKEQKNYFLSLHYEAKARMHYLRFQKAKKELDNSKNKFNLLKTFCKMAKEKWQSFIFVTDSYKAFSKRFSEPDNWSANPLRHYKINY